MMRRALLLLFVVFGAAAAAKTQDQLQLVQVVIRHGDRAAQDRFATDESAEVLFRGLGELSDLGIDHAHKQGEDFKKRYIEEFKLIDERFIPSQARFQSSGLSRVLMSAGSFANALFRTTPKNGEHTGGNPVVPPIYTTDFNNDPLLAPKFDCANGWDDVVAALNLTDSTDAVHTSLAAMESTMWPDSCKDVPANKVDAIIAEYPNKKIKMPAAYDKCAKMPAKQFMYDYIELLGGSGYHYNEERLKRTVGLLTTELLKNMNTKAKCSASDDACLNKNEKFRVYYSHDVNVLALSHVFKSINQYNKITPAFSSALVLELWHHETNGHYVKILLKDGQDAKFVDTGLSADETTLLAVNEFASKYAINSTMPCDPPNTA